MPQRLERATSIGEYQLFRINALLTVPNSAAIGAWVSTTSSTAIGGAGVATVTVATGGTQQMTVGMLLAVYLGTGTAEIVQITALNQGANQFTATFQNAHSGTYTISSVRGTWLGPVIVGGAGSAVTLTFYNGNPNITGANALNLPGYGATISSITPSAGGTYPFEASVDYGLFYSYTGTTPGDLSVHYLSQPI